MKTVIDRVCQRTHFTSQICCNYKSRLFFWVCGGQWLFCLHESRRFTRNPGVLIWSSFCFMADNLRENSDIQMLFQKTPAENILYLTLWFMLTGTGARLVPATHRWFQPHVLKSTQARKSRVWMQDVRWSLYVFIIMFSIYFYYFNVVY